MLVSICIPAFNSPDLLRKCLNSIVTQTFQDFELVISDDSSSDAVKKVIDSYNFENKLVYQKNPTPLGSPANWNMALSLAKGEFIKIMHHDDYFTNSSSLANFVSVIENNSAVDFICCSSNIYFSKKNRYFLHKQTTAQIKRVKNDPVFLFFRNVIGAPSATFYRNQQDMQFNSNYKWLVDVEFYIRYLKKYSSIAFIPEPLVTIVDGAEGQITHSVFNDKDLVVSENLLLFSEIYSEKLNNSKSILFFEELFLSFNMHTASQLFNKFTVPSKIEKFMYAVFENIPKHRFYKKVVKRILTSRYNKTLFKIERF
jgi:glycosyltransferase involved in cell wall biosynthesis